MSQRMPVICGRSSSLPTANTVLSIPDTATEAGQVKLIRSASSSASGRVFVAVDSHSFEFAVGVDDHSLESVVVNLEGHFLRHLLEEVYHAVGIEAERAFALSSHYVEGGYERVFHIRGPYGESGTGEGEEEVVEDSEGVFGIDHLAHC